jgi:cyclopropane fatty-acyl-phospholipid synthase-like methyltransferase
VCSIKAWGRARIDYIDRHARAAGVHVELAVDDLLATQLTGPYEVIFDRGCFHVVAPARRAEYIDVLHRLLAPGGWLLLKTFSQREPGAQGPYRFTPKTIAALFGDRFEIVSVDETDYQGQRQPWPKALFSSLRKR